MKGMEKTLKVLMIHRSKGISVAPSCHLHPVEPPPWNSYGIPEAERPLTCPWNPCAGPSQSEKKLNEGTNKLDEEA